MKKKNLFIPLFALLVMACVFMPTSKVYAVTTAYYNVDNNQIKSVIMDTGFYTGTVIKDYSVYDYVIVFNHPGNGGWVRVLYSNKEIYQQNVNARSALYAGGLDLFSVDVYSGSSFATSEETSVYLSGYIPLYSNYDVMYGANGDSVFFSAPAPVPLVKTAEELPPAIIPVVRIITIVAVCCLGLLIGSVTLVPRLARSFLR